MPPIASVRPLGTDAGGNITPGLIQVADLWSLVVTTLSGGICARILTDQFQTADAAVKNAGLVVVRAETAHDVIYQLFSYTNLAAWGDPGVPASSLITLPSALAPSLAVVQSASGGETFPDIEVAINNGSSIYSVSSNTFTEP